MKRYRVIFTDSAKEEIFKSYEWGCREWGKTKAQQWARELRESVEKVLKIFPLSQPIAPETVHFSIEVRQIIVGRYRILYVINERTVSIIHVRGAFVKDPD